MTSVIVVALSIPVGSSERFRGGIVSMTRPLWEGVQAVTHAIAKPFSSISFSAKSKVVVLNAEKEKLTLENLHLHDDLNVMRDILADEQRLIYHPDSVKDLGITVSIPAKVIYRDPASWSSSLWLNVGTDNNKTIGSIVVAKDSPVVVGTDLVGVVDCVGKKQCRIRLITDSGLNPSVRTTRGQQQAHLIKEKISSIRKFLDDGLQGLMPDEENVGFLKRYLEEWEMMLSKQSEEWRLAKGTLSGSSAPLWKSGGRILKGTGFNYDYADKEGDARDLLTGKPLDKKDGDAVQLVRNGDILITTGMDGVFPQGLRVATVTKLFALKEGSYGYDFEAIPTVENLEALTHVSVLPPLQ